MANTKQKPDKPYHDFPLFAHRNGQWTKKTKGKLCYFGPWNKPEEALEKYNQEYAPLPSGGTRKLETYDTTKKTDTGKPKKPYPDFPLFAHQNGQWAKTVRGRTHYFGPWANPKAAINLYIEHRTKRRFASREKRAVPHCCERSHSCQSGLTIS